MAKPKQPLTSKEVIPSGILVHCALPSGLRRAGRHWPHGETRVDADALTADQIAAIQADPAFTLTVETEAP